MQPTSADSRSPAVQAAGRAARARHPYLHPCLLDTIYMGVLGSSATYLLATGKARKLRDHIPRRLRDIRPRTGDRPCVWVHGVSVGELLSARRFLHLFEREFPQWEVVLSSTTSAGLEAASRHYPSRRVISYPFDFSRLVKRAFERIRPDLIVIVEHELWPNFLWRAGMQGIPVVIVNARLSERSLRGYRWLSRIGTWPPPGVVTICAQDEASAGAFRRLGAAAGCIRVTGNFKFDNVPVVEPGIREELGMNGAEWVLVASSTHPGEEEVLLDSFEALWREDRRSRLIIAPRRVERAAEVDRIVARRGLRATRWSRMGNGVSPAPAHDGENGCGEVIVVDTVGDVERLLSAGDVVFVGGSLVPLGGHNVIAPASIGRPVIIGPHFENFRTVVAHLLERDALLVANDAGELSRKIRELKRDPGRARRLAEEASETVALHAGASERTLETLRPIIESVNHRREPGS
jgi:3-deoxy-D-manno-octulosonic-acid transferase